MRVSLALPLAAAALALAIPSAQARNFPTHPVRDPLVMHLHDHDHFFFHPFFRNQVYWSYFPYGWPNYGDNAGNNYGEAGAPSPGAVYIAAPPPPPPQPVAERPPCQEQTAAGVTIVRGMNCTRGH